MEKICANCKKWRVSDTSEVSGHIAKLNSAVQLIEEPSAVWKTLINSSRSSLLISKGVRSCSIPMSGIYGTGNCAVPEEFSPQS